MDKRFNKDFNTDDMVEFTKVVDDTASIFYCVDKDNTECGVNESGYSHEYFCNGCINFRVDNVNEAELHRTCIKADIVTQYKRLHPTHGFETVDFQIDDEGTVWLSVATNPVIEYELFYINWKLIEIHWNNGDIEEILKEGVIVFNGLLEA